MVRCGGPCKPWLTGAKDRAKLKGKRKRDFQKPWLAFKLGLGYFEMGTIMMQMPFDTSMLAFLMVGEALFAIPAGMVLKRTGHSPWWALLCFIPVAAMAGLWVLAFTSWTPRSTE
jgi:uncharacterized membrane protein YhaH (DUF805 family)